MVSKYSLATVVNMRANIDDNFGWFVAFSALAAVVMTVFFIKVTGRDEEHLNKTMFRTAVLVAAANLLVYLVMTHGRDSISTAPFFDK